MEVTLNIRRFDPDTEQPASYDQEYTLQLDDTSTVLDGLIKIREEIDGSLAMRCSCRSAICGSCTMRINGQARLACNTRMTDAVEQGDGTIVVEPPGNMPVIKDLVVDFSPFWDKISAAEPWLLHMGDKPQHEYTASNESMLHLADVMGCIMCGACVSDCTVLEVDPNFLGPAALAKAYRFVADPRDSEHGSRVGNLTEYGGVWDCTRCMQCVEVCPKDVDPMGRIMALRDMAMEAGYRHSDGGRHATAFSSHVEHSGRVDELRLPIQSKGMSNGFEMLKLVPVGLRAILRRKMPPIIHRKNPGQRNVRRIFDNADQKR